MKSTNLTEKQKAALERGREIANQRKKERKHFSELKKQSKRLTKIDRRERFAAKEIEVNDIVKFHDLTNIGEDDKKGWSRKREADRYAKQHIILKVYNGKCPYCLIKRSLLIEKWVEVTSYHYRMLMVWLQRNTQYTKEVAEDVKLNKPYCCQSCWSSAYQSFKRSDYADWKVYVLNGSPCLTNSEIKNRLINKRNGCCSNCNKRFPFWKASRCLSLVKEVDSRGVYHILLCRRCLWARKGKLIK